MPNPRDVERVRRLFRTLPSDRILEEDEISVELGPPRLSGRRLAGVLRSLLKQRELVRRRGQGYHARPRERGLEGQIERRARGHARLRCADANYYIPPAELADFVDGDAVRAELDHDRRGRPFARNLELATRRNRRVVGVVQHVGEATLVEAEDGRFTQAVLVDTPDAAQAGDLVEVELDRAAKLRGRVVRVLGTPGPAALEVTRIVINNGIELEHPADVEAEAAAIDGALTDAERAKRVDLRDLDLVTIDGADACDFDDAIAVARRPSGYRLWVAIADVAHHVSSGGALDREARRRATSIYWPAGVAHMLPERLAADLCSLRPDVERLAMVAEMDFDNDGGMTEASLFEAVIRSRARLTYEQVNGAHAGDSAALAELGEHWPRIELMTELARLLENRLNRAGRLELDIPEPCFELDDHGEPVDAFPRPMGRAERLIEAFMVAANAAVARWCQARQLPVLYRVHETPPPQRLELFADTASALTGKQVPQSPSARTLSRALAGAKRKSEKRLLSSLLLRSLPQARYDPRPLGHYGLGAPDYLHFTSPIRRYPDLLVHRALKADLLDRRPRKGALSEINAITPGINARERAAMSLERTIDTMLSTHLAARCVGQRFEGTILGVERFGLFVGVERPLFEGLLPTRRLIPDDYYRLSDDGLALLGRRRRGRWRLGDSIAVEVLAVDVPKLQVDLGHVPASDGGSLDTSRSG